MTMFKTKIFEDCVKAEAHNPVQIIDIAIRRFEKLIDEKSPQYLQFYAVPDFINDLKKGLKE